MEASAGAGPHLGSGRVSTDSRERVGLRRIDADLARLLQDRRVLPPVRNGERPGPGEVGEPITLPLEIAQRAFRLALADGLGLGAATRRREVVWTDGDSELLVRAAGVRIRCDDGLVLVGIPVYTDETSEAEIVVAFAVGGRDAPAGLLIVTESTPRGPALLVDRWGDALVAAAWDALIDVCAGVAAASGDDAAGRPLLPAALTATSETLVVLPQARFEPLGRRG